LGEAVTLLLAVVMMGGAPVAGDLADEDAAEADVQPDVAEARVDSDAVRGSASPSPDNATDPNGSLSAQAPAGDAGPEAAADPGEGHANVSTTPFSMQVALSDGELVELSSTPTLDTAPLEHRVPADPVEEDADEDVEAAGQQQTANDDAGGEELAWTIAPVAGVAAAAAAGQALPVTRWLRRLLPGLAPTPMFTRIARDEVLEHESREAIYELLDERAGLSLEAICRELDLARSTARHHVRKLEQANMIEHTRMGRSRVHHLVGERHRAVREHLLTNGTREAVYEAVTNEALTITGIAEHLDVNPGSVHFHLGKLEEAGLVETVGEEGRRYRARDPTETEARIEPV
jgi:DNA-binding transcriptional ArsR family regulator